MTAVLKAVSKPINDEDTIKRIERYIESPPENSRIFTITPGVAQHLLATYNAGNRPKKPANISTYASHMAAQTWALNGENIKFSDARILRDGQNRLMACVRSGVPFQTHVVFGIDDTAFHSMDQGKNRGGSDVLAIAGYSNTTNLAGAVRWAYLIDEGRTKQRDTLRADVILRLVTERYKDLPSFIAPASAIYRVTGQPIGLVAALLHAFNGKNHEKAERFIAAWSGGDEHGKFAALGKLRKKIATISTSSSGRVHDVVRAALIVRAWNAFVEGRSGTGTEFEWSTTEAFPEIKG